MRFVKFVCCCFILIAGWACMAVETTDAEAVLTRDSVLGYLKKCEKTIIADKDERGEKMTRLHYMGYAMTVYSWMKKPDELELATGIDREWFSQVYEKFDDMWVCRRQIDLAEDNESKKKVESEKNFEKTVKEFSLLLAKPAEVQSAKLLSLKKSKDTSISIEKAKKSCKKADAETVI